MSPERPSRRRESGDTPLQALARLTRRMAVQDDPVEALWLLLGDLRQGLSIDRVGIFATDPVAGALDRVVGVDPHGKPEYAGQCFPLTEARHPLIQVARRELPYYLTDDAPRDYPEVTFRPGVRAHAIIPIIAGDEFLGALCADNSLTDRPLPEEFLEPLFLYAGLAALPLFALFQKRERERTEAFRRRLANEVLSAVTDGRFNVCSQEELEREWPAAENGITISEKADVRRVRDAVHVACEQAGMAENRAADLVLCASEAATNALLHGNGGLAVVGAREGRVRVRVSDQGHGINTEDLPRATLLKGWSTRASMGLGFTIINETADRVLLHTGPAGTTLIIEMAVEPPRPSPKDNPLSGWDVEF